MPTHELPQTAIQLMVDLSTRHMTKRDAELCHQVSSQGITNDVPRITEHAHGFIVFVNSEPDHVARSIIGMAEKGFSPAFIDIYHRAATGQEIHMLIDFDTDGAEVEGLPFFEW